MRHVSDQRRRARLAVRHAFAPAHRARTPEAVTRAMTVPPATEPVTVHAVVLGPVAAIERARLARDVVRSGLAPGSASPACD
ncbi:hypothetical protein Daura_25400 [Dactylosporangium aurantiacum]|uniref:Uncharacterized protein n=1 Tax=Dactylosporangium aurantiacum TaxID=35754 RepID=A0A9Q9MLP6_9ACTN|nr:hypothetical protein [Dactylosporangium aurantiacum]MDG6107958.1 hypothetical protein [Dactylosporangium aurantiacum]UWZ59200.1 hypothetical protein Daura_25400 [Dactylosporangium aurantiacum]